MCKTGLRPAAGGRSSEITINKQTNKQTNNEFSVDIFFQIRFTESKKVVIASSEIVGLPLISLVVLFTSFKPLLYS